MELVGSLAGWDARDWRLATGMESDAFDFTTAAVAIQGCLETAAMPREWGDDALAAWRRTGVVLHAYYETYRDDEFDVVAFEAVLHTPRWGWVGIEVEYFPPEDDEDSDVLDIEEYIYTAPDPHALTVGADGHSRLLKHLVPERLTPSETWFLSSGVAAALQPF